MVIGEAIRTTDVAIVGAGPGGYVAAIRLAQLGKKVILIDRESVGGVCLHHGCIPSKAIIYAAQALAQFKKAEAYGLSGENFKFDVKKLHAWKDGIVERLDKGIRALLKHYGVTFVQANAFFESSSKLGIRPISGELDFNAVEFKKCIIAIGSQERILPGITIDGDKIITSWHTIHADKLPDSVIIIGGGYIGIELSNAFCKMGVKVTIVESMPSILSQLDEDCSNTVKESLIRQGVEIFTNAKVEKIDTEKKPKVIITCADGSAKELSADKIAVAVGRIPNIKDLELENTKVTVSEKGYISVNEQMQSSDPRIYAIGDVVGGVMLAHKASKEAKVAADAICGKKTAFDNVIPFAIFCDPEIAGVGLTEKEAKERKIAYNAKKFSYMGLGKAHILHAQRGFIKMLYDDNKTILGVHIVGERASDMIGEAVLAIEMGATVEDLSMIIHPHPTLAESYSEVADMALGFPLHMLG